MPLGGSPLGATPLGGTTGGGPALPDPVPGSGGGAGPPSGQPGGPGTITGPGTAFGHDYQVIVGTMHANPTGFVPLGEVQAAIPTSVAKELNAIGAAAFTFPQLGVPYPSMIAMVNRDGPHSFPLAQDGDGIAYNSGQYLLPPSVIPAVREVQFWRDGQIIDWTVPVTARGDSKAVTVTCAGLLWYFSRLNFGPTTRNYINNGEFEVFAAGNFTDWTPVNVTVALETTTVNRGKQAMRLTHNVYDDFSYASQTFTYTAPVSEGTFFEMDGSVWVDPAVPFVGGAVGDLMFYMEGRLSGVVQQKAVSFLNNQVAGTAHNGFIRLTTGNLPAFIVPAGQTWDIECRIYCGDCSIVVDSVTVSVQESVGSNLEGSDVATIIQRVVDYANDPNRGKSPHYIPFQGDATGVILQRFYQFADNANLLDALNEFPTIGVADFDIQWDAAGQFRWFQLYSPAKGSILLNQVIEIDAGQPDPTQLAFEANGTQTSSAIRNLGQGNGLERLFGYAVDASALGGRQVTDMACTYGSVTITSASANFTAADIGVGVYSAGNLPIGAVIHVINSTTSVDLTLPATFTVAVVMGVGATLGIGGLILDEVISDIPTTPDRLLQSHAATELSRTRAANLVPTSTLRADGPNGKFGLIDVGDIIVSLVDLGWAQETGEQRRIVKWELKPETEEFLVTHNLVPAT